MSKFKVALEVAELTQPCSTEVEVLPVIKVTSVTNAEAVIVVTPKILRDKNIEQPEGGFGILGKRSTPEKTNRQATDTTASTKGKSINITSFFKPTSSSGKQVVKD